MQPMTEDIAPEPEAASPPPAPERSPAPWPRRWRGHGEKIAAVVVVLRAAGKLPPHLRPGFRTKLILDELDKRGYRDDRPSTDAISRWWDKYG